MTSGSADWTIAENWPNLSCVYYLVHSPVQRQRGYSVWQMASSPLSEQDSPKACPTPLLLPATIRPTLPQLSCPVRCFILCHSLCSYYDCCYYQASTTTDLLCCPCFYTVPLLTQLLLPPPLLLLLLPGLCNHRSPVSQEKSEDPAPGKIYNDC